MMNRAISKILLPLPSLVRWYLSKKRTYKAHGLVIDVMPGVFHPGFFFSSEMMLVYLSRQALQGKKLLEVGAGSGMIALYAAKHGAEVTAIDISSQALENIRLNAQNNRLGLQVVHSDLFANVQGKFDWIVVNPPYYPRNPANEAEYAWYCGVGHEYFSRFFAQLRSHMSADCQAVMVLSDVCDLEAISAAARQNDFRLTKVEEKKVWADGRNYIFNIKPLA